MSVCEGLDMIVSVCLCLGILAQIYVCVALDCPLLHILWKQREDISQNMNIARSFHVLSVVLLPCSVFCVHGS